MSMTIYYFSGTGNSLAVARSLEEQIDHSTIINIAKLTDMEKMTDQSDTVGLVFPVYFEDMPDIVKTFVEKLQFKAKTYVFGIATCGEGAGFALYSLRRLVEEKGIELAAGFAVKMPDNVVFILSKIPQVDVQESMISLSKEKIAQIVEIVRKRGYVGIEGEKRLADKLENIIVKAIVTRIYRISTRFRITNGCTRCGICQKICPTGNVKVRDEEVIWGTNCTNCLACLHWCPSNAIILGSDSQNSMRYHHPEITVKKMILR